METKEEEKIERYMEEIEEGLSDCSDEEKIEILMRKVRYWYGSAQEWCRLFEREREVKR